MLLRIGRLVAMTLTLLLSARSAALHAQPTNPPPWTNEWRITAYPHHPIKGNLSAYGHLDWAKDPDSNYTEWYLGYPGLIYNLRPHIQLWGGLLGVYTDNEPATTGKPDTLELRPFIGAKLFVPNKKKWNIYNLTRLEFRETYSHGTREWTNVERLRARFGIETPFGDREKAWKPGSFYGVANTEPMFVFDKDYIDPFRIQVGAGYIPNGRVRVELLYTMNWSRVAPSNDLAFTQNIIRLTVKVSTSRGLLDRVWNPAN